MSNPKQFVATDDWRIKPSGNIGVNVGLGLGIQKWEFYSPRLHYACACYLPNGSVGLSIGIDLSVIGSELIDQVASGALSMDQEHVTILRPFSANDLDGGSIGAISFGARGVVAGASGQDCTIKSSASRDIVEYRGGEVSAGLGVEVNMGRLTIGSLYGPYEIRPPAQILKAV